MQFKDEKSLIKFLKEGLSSGNLPGSVLISGNAVGGVFTAVKDFAVNNFHPLDALFLSPDFNPENKSEKEESTYGIDRIRSIKEFFSVKPWNNKKIVIINEAHRLKHEAQNAFLKILEEPPVYGFLILITPKPDLLFPTIRSRLYRLDFNDRESGQPDTDEIKKFIDGNFFEQSNFLQELKSKGDFENFYKKTAIVLQQRIEDGIDRKGDGKKLEKYIELAKKIISLEKNLYSLNLNARIQMESVLLRLLKD